MSLIAIISAAGIAAPSYAEIYSELQTMFRNIYGNDAYLDPDSQDGQLLAVFAQALHDANQTAVDAYNSFSPASAIGAALSNNVAINGIHRRVPTKSQVLVELVGQANSVIANGLVSSNDGTKWALPELVVIGLSGVVVVTAEALDFGDIKAAAGTITNIVTPAKGWQSVINRVAAVPGAPAETDGDLRVRQRLSTANPSQGIMKSIAGSVASVPGVLRSRVYENDTGYPNEYGHPPHSITAVALGGDAQAIAQAIYQRKTPGAYTNGTTEVEIADLDNPVTIRFYFAEQVPVRVAIDAKALNGFVSTTTPRIQQAVADYINNLGIGRKVDQGRLFLPAQFYGQDATTPTFEINAVRITDDPLAPAVDSDLEIAFNAIATCDPDDVIINMY